MKKKKNFDVWSVMSVLIMFLYALFLIYPLFMLLRTSVVVDGKFSFSEFVNFFSNPYNITSVFNSIKVSICATILTLVLGVPLAYFYQMYEIKGKSILQILIILCSMSAPFIGAYAWINLLGSNGVITKFFLQVLNIKIGDIYGFSGILLVQAFQLFPLVFLYVCGALKNIDSSLLEASENMGCKGIRRFFKVVIPLCMPTILAATLLVFMRAFADYGTPLMIGKGYQTFPVIIYDSYFNETGGNHSFGAAVAIIAIVITAVIFLIQQLTNKHFRFSMNAMHSIERKKIKGIKSVLIHIFCWLSVIISFMPQIYVIYSSFLRSSGKLLIEGEYSLGNYEYFFNHMTKSIPNTFIVGLLALFIVVILAIIIAYLTTRRSNVPNKIIDTLSMIPYIIPGSVVGIAFVLGFNGKPFMLAGTIMIMVLALVVRRIPYTIRSSVAILQQIPMSIEEAAISLGSGRLKTFFTITVPMMAHGVLSGAILSWVTIITELSTGVVLFNLNTITLTLAVYTYVQRGSYGYAAATATILTVTTIISLLIYMLVSKNKEVSM